MKSMRRDEVAKKLVEGPIPLPPEGLLERIVDEIPEEIGLSQEPADDCRVRRLRPRRHWHLAAAAVLTLALCGTLAWQLRHRGLSPELAEGYRHELVATPAPGPARPRVAEVETEPELPEGEYTVEASLPRFETGSESGVSVTRDGVAEVDLAMAVARFSDEIAVTAEAPVVDVTSTATGIVVSPQPAPTPAPRADTRVSFFGSTSPRVQSGRDFETGPRARPSTGGTTEPNDQPYGDVFFEGYGVNPFIDTEDDHLSTFGLEVDTGSYTVIRRFLSDGHLPPRDAVRVEEVLNAFDFGDRAPAEGDFGLHAEGTPSPFAHGERYHLLRFAVTAREVDADARPPAVLTFVVDVSGSMSRENRLGLVKKALYELLDHLRSNDLVALVVYGSRGEVLLEPSSDHEAVRAAIDRLQSGGSTNAEEGLVLAYELAARHLDEERINRVILCSDGVANVGRTGPDSILERIRVYAEQGIELSTIGFGMGNYNDVLMEQLADSGDGRYAYVDSLAEARRLFVEELTGTLLTVARNTKAQVDFNPEAVSRYRLLGYENRDIADERFRDPTVDAGEIGAGHRVTALYEVKLHPRVSRRATLATLRLRYTPAGSHEEAELERQVRVGELARHWDKAPASLRLATLVAEYAEILKGAYWAREGDINEVLRRAQELQPEFAGNARVAEFVGLVARAAELEEAQEGAGPLGE